MFPPETQKNLRVTVNNIKVKVIIISSMKTRAIGMAGAVCKDIYC
jgi:hypothetical protein